MFKRTPGIGLPVVLVFEKNADPRRAMIELESMRRNQVLTIDSQDDILVTAVMLSGDWGGDQNRRIRVVLKRDGRVDLFMHLAEHLDRIELHADHPLMGLQSGRLKKRNEAKEQILTTWISEKIKTELVSWGLSLDTELVEEDGGFHQLKITMRLDAEVIQIYWLDGWSGELAVGEERFWTLRQIGPKTFERCVLVDIEDYIEAMTA